jgi:phosphatidylglycerol lysyltransferase
MRPWALGGVGVVLALAVGLALRSLLVDVRYVDVMAAVHATPALAIAMAILCTAVSYLVLSAYDSAALNYVGATVERSTVLLTSFVAYALSNNVGLGPLTGGAVRMRLYASAGLEPPQIARVIAFNAAAFGLGISAFGALSLLWGARSVSTLLHVQPAFLRAAAMALLGALVLFVRLCARQRVLTLGSRFSLRLPLPALAVRQLAISAVELSASASALWVLLPQQNIALSSFVALYAIAISVGLITHVPGGVGVFEAVMLLASGNSVPTDAMLAALLLYRGIYYVLPLVFAAALLVIYELRTGVAAPIGKLAVRLSPRLMAALTLVAGVWLVVSGATPLTENAHAMLAAFRLPVPLIEASHFLASVAGLGLLLLARGLLHQLDAAWWGAVGLSILAAILALPKGVALNEAALLCALLGLLVISRRQFNRQSSLFAQRLEPEWLLAVAGVIAACVWVLFFAYRQVSYSHSLWWQFELDAQAPRSLRALLGVALAGMAFWSWQLMRPAAGDVNHPSQVEISRAAAIARASPKSDGCYALMGDKHFMFSASGKSFLMFGKQGRSWVSLFGPTGESREWPDLVWQFVELATAHGGRAAFYQVRPATIPLYLDCGLNVYKLGEYAYVPLADFTLQGAKRANLRSGVNRAEREGLTFEVLAPSEVGTILTELRAVSDAWLGSHKTREKGFSVGQFNEQYLQRLPLAVVRREGVVIAFANLMVTDAKDEASVDLMRFVPTAPPGTMDFLFARIMLYLQAEGYRRFGLGMSPMAGMAERRRAPRWQRLGRLLFEYGERLYGFRGLHHFKSKFEPVWEARYLAAPGGLTPMFLMADLVALIGGGFKGAIAK